RSYVGVPTTALKVKQTMRSATRQVFSPATDSLTAAVAANNTGPLSGSPRALNHHLDGRAGITIVFAAAVAVARMAGAVRPVPPIPVGHGGSHWRTDHQRVEEASSALVAVASLSVSPSIAARQP